MVLPVRGDKFPPKEEQGGTVDESKKKFYRQCVGEVMGGSGGGIEEKNGMGGKGRSRCAGGR